MKQLLILICLLSTTIVRGQQITLTNGTDTVKVSMIPEKVGEQVSYDMCFHLVYQYNTNGYILEEWTDYWVNGYTAYFYIRQNFEYEWVRENIEYSEDFRYTLTSTENY